MAAVNGLAIGSQFPFSQLASLAFSSQLVDASNDGLAMTFRAATANAITHLGFRYGARTGTPPTYRISLQSLSATTGNPDGTVVGGGSPASATFTPPADGTWDGTWQWIALSNSYTPSVGQQLVIVIEYSSGTIDASNRASFSYMATVAATSNIGEEYGLTLTAGTWAKVTDVPVFGVRTASERYGHIFTAISSASVTTQTHRVAIKFRLPTDSTNIFDVERWSAILTLGSAAKTPKTGIWNAAGTELQAVTMDSDVMRSPGTAQRLGTFQFGSRASLSAGTWYYLGLEAVDASPGTLAIYYFQVASADDRQAWPGGIDMMLATWNGSAWTDVDTGFPMCSIELATMTQASGSSGGGYVIGG